MTIMGLNFVKTCPACPEQYDVFDSTGKQVGYVRLRWGRLRCDYPKAGAETIYLSPVTSNTRFIGHFDSEEQRQYYLNLVANSILTYIELNKENR